MRHRLFRSPQTIGQLRAFANFSDDEINVHGFRQSRVKLPTDWDDIPIERTKDSSEKITRLRLRRLRRRSSFKYYQ
jgi:hypothetical protein